MGLTILHISDLHFAADLLSPTHWLQKVHGPRLLDALSRYWERRPTDYLVVTGDISTDGELQSLENARRFLMDKIPVNGGEWQGAPEFGLNVRDPDRLFLVPGNHDRYTWRGLGISRQITRFEDVFGDMFHNKGRPRRAGWMEADGLRIRVLSIDSMGKARKFSPAAGRVHDEDMEWLRQMYREDSQNKENWDLRLLLLHHHVALPDTREFSRLTKLKNRAELLQTDTQKRRALSKNG